MNKNIQQRLRYTPIALVALIAGLTLWSEFVDKASIAPQQELNEWEQLLASRGGTFDDGDEKRFPKLFQFFVQSDEDTSEIDAKIESYYQWILEWTPDYLWLSNAQIWVRLQAMCNSYDDICERMKLQTEFKMKEVYNFTVFTIYLITQIDRNVQLEWVVPLRNTLDSIMFDKDSEDTTRGKAWHRNMMINTYDMRDRLELLEIITHELGHIMDLWAIQWTHEHINQEYVEFDKPSFATDDRSLRFYAVSWESKVRKRSFTRDAHLVSLYGGTNIFEDFAEFFNAWTNHHAPLIELAKNDEMIRKKYFLFKELFGKRYLNDDVNLYLDLDVNTRPYDTSRWQDHLAPVN